MSRVFIEPIPSEEELLQTATAEEIAIVEQFGSAHRRREVLAWRAIVRRELGGDCKIGYDEWGAPEVSLPEIYISVSHSREVVAVIIGSEPCAIDIEECERNFGVVAERFTTAQERTLSNEEDWLAKLWCAKEALYKYYRKGGVEISEDIKILGYNADSTSLQASVLGTLLEVKVERQGKYIVAIID